MKVIDRLALFLARIYNYLLLHYKCVECGQNVLIEGKIDIIGRARSFTIGSGTRIVSCRRKNPLGGGTQTVFSLGDNSIVKIGENSGISNSVIRVVEGITIGNNVNIGGDCKFYDSDMHSVDYRNRMEIPDTHILSAPIVIEDGVWIGAHSIILKGVAIGKQSVIAAGSVVTKNVPSDELWGGNPARFIRKINSNLE